MISWVAIERVVEQKRATDPEYRRESEGKLLRSDARRLTDDELLAKLRGFGITLDQSELGRLCGQALSAEEIARPLLDSTLTRQSSSAKISVNGSSMLPSFVVNVVPLS